MNRSNCLCLILLCALYFSLQAQRNSHVQEAEALDSDQSHLLLRRGVLERDTNLIYQASYDLLLHHTDTNNWDSIYYYNEKVAESALVLGLMDKHLASLINNISMDQMFGRKGISLPQRYDYLQKHLEDEMVSVMYKSEIASMIAGKYYRSGEVDSVFYYQKMAVDFADIKDDHQKRRISTRIQLASYYRDFRRSSEALKYLIEIESDLEQSLLPAMQKISFYSSITHALLDINDLERAMDYLEKFRLQIEDNNYDSQFRKFYQLEADIKSKQGDHQSAIDSYHKAIDYAKEGSNKESELFLWTRIAGQFQKLGKQDSVRVYLDSLALYESELNDRMKVSYYCSLHTLAMAEQNFPKALRYLKIVNQQLGHVKTNEIHVALLNNKYFESIGNTEKAYKYYKKYSILSDSLRVIQNASLAKSIETRFNRDKQDAEINLLKVTNTAQDKALAVRNNTILLGGIMMLILGGLLFGLYRLYKRNQESQNQLAIQNKQITKALEQNQILIKEIHHRVKNNLQVISSLLSLQERKVDDEATKEALKSSQTRVQTMSLIHKSLYQKDDVRSIDIVNYFKQLAENLVSSFAIHPVDLRLDVDEMSIDIDSLVPLGLVANELICNALKHGINDRADGILYIGLKEIDDEIVLSVEDNGGNLGEDNLIRKEGSLGTRLIQAFTANLEGELIVKGGDTTKISLKVEKDKIIFSDI